MCEHAPSTNPRHEGSCVRCGRVLVAERPPRDTAYETEYLDQVEREAQRRFGVNAAGYKLTVERRLELGAQRYGDDDFTRKDVLRELLEETPDVTAYCLLEAQKLLAEGLDDEDGAAWHLFEASVHAAAADWHARQARSA